MTEKTKEPANELPAIREKREASSFLESAAVLQAVAKVTPKHLTPERLTRVAITAVMSKPELIQAAAHPTGRASLLNALMRCSQAGLEPDGRLAHLIPFWSGEHKCHLVQVIFDYKGLIVLARRNGIDAKGILVREKDKFRYVEDDGTGRTVVHHEFDPLKDRGEIVGAYSRAVEEGKPVDYEFMSRAEIDATRERSRAKDKGPWVTDFGEMARKCPIRRHSKRWELQPEIRDLLNTDDDTPEPLQMSVVEGKLSRPIFDQDKKLPAPEAANGGPVADSKQHPGKLPQQPPASQQDAEADAAAAREDKARESSEGTDLAPQTPPAQPASTPQAPAAKPSVLVGLRGLCRIARIPEGKLLDHLSQLGSTDGSLASLEELVTVNPVVAKAVCDSWPSISAAIKRGEKGAAK